MLEKSAAPFCNRQVHHIGHDIDTRDQPAAESEPFCNRIVVHLVFGKLCGVEGLDAVGFEPACHSISLIMVIFSVVYRTRRKCGGKRVAIRLLLAIPVPMEYHARLENACRVA